jgi:hypothetical protein
MIISFNVANIIQLVSLCVGIFLVGYLIGYDNKNK